MLHDLRQAVRTLGKHPGFTLLSACVLALGIGLNGAIFAIVRSLLFTPFPVLASRELVSIYQVLPRQPDRPTVLNRQQYRHLVEHNELFTDISAHWAGSLAVRIDGETEMLTVASVLSNYFDVLGVKPLLGRRLIATEDDVANPARAVVISHALWVRRFAADPRVLGKTLEIGRWGETFEAFTVVGVMAPEFRGVSEPWKPAHVWLTFAQREDSFSNWSGVVMARLRPGVSVPQARAVVTEQSRQHYASTPRPDPAFEPRWVVYPTDSVKTPFDPSAAVIPTRLAAAMTLVVALVLLVAAANIAGILAVRGVGRAGEIAIRRSLGASTARIMRQLLIESLILAFGGGVLGVLLAAMLVHLFVVLTPMRFAFEVGIDAVVLLFAVGICVAAGLVVGLIPARQSRRIDVLPWLTGSSGFQTAPPLKRMRYGVTIPQAAISLVLMLTAGVYVRSLLAMELADLGYQPGNLLVANVTLMTPPAERVRREMSRGDRRLLEARYAERTRRFYFHLLDRIRTLPGAAHVALAGSLPLQEGTERADWSAVTEDALRAGRKERAAAERAMVSPGYFGTLGIRVLSGRDFDGRDTMTTPAVAVVSAGLAQSLWPGADAIGRRLALVSTWNANEEPEQYLVVGVVSDVRPIVQERPRRPFIYLPLSQQWRPYSAIVLARSSGDSRTLIPAVKDAVARADGLADVFRAQMMSELVSGIMYPRRIAGAILGISGLIALFLAALGTYGVVSYAVAQRTAEIGVRMALGADRADIRRLVLTDGIFIAAGGMTLGVTLGYIAIRFVSSAFIALPRLDIPTLIVIPLLFTSVIMLACYLPARRAGHVDPLHVLRRT